MLSLQEVNAITNKHIVPLATDVVYLQSPTFVRLHTKRAERFDGGTLIQRPLMYAELNGGAVGRGGTFNIDVVPTDTAITITPKVYYVGITLVGYDDLINRGPDAVFSQAESKFRNASAKMAKLLATDMYLNGQVVSGVDRTLNLNGFAEWYDDGNTYTTVGGLNRADLQTIGTVGGMNAYVDTTFAAFTLPKVNLAYARSWFGADHVDLISVTVPGWTNFWNATQPLQRYMDTKSDVGEIGFQSFRFNGAEVVVDQYMPAQTAYGMNTNYIEWYMSTNPRFQFGFTGFKENQQTLDVAGQFLYGGNIMVPNPRTGFKLTGTSL